MDALKDLYWNYRYFKWRERHRVNPLVGIILALFSLAAVICAVVDDEVISTFIRFCIVGAVVIFLMPLVQWLYRKMEGSRATPATSTEPANGMWAWPFWLGVAVVALAIAGQL